MTRLVPGEPLDKAARKRLARLLQAVAGDLGERGAQLAAERVLVLAPLGEVTVELAAFIGKALALAVPHCPRCLDVSVGLCNPCRPLHAREAEAAQRGLPVAVALAQPAAAIVVEAAPPRTERSLDDMVAECTRKKRYSTQRLAEEVRAKCELRAGRPMRVYACTAGCGGWHITSQKPRAS